MNNKMNTGKVLCAVLISGMLVAIPSVSSKAAVITSNATDKIAVAFHENTAYSAGDYIIYDGEMYICTDDIQGAWETAKASFMQITKNHDIGSQEDLSAAYDAAKDPSEEKSLMAFAANAWHKLKVFFGMENKNEDIGDVNQYKNASVSAKLNFLQRQNQQLDQNVANLQGWITQSFQSVSNGKSIMAATITDKGIQVGAQDSFQKFNQAIKDLALLQYNNGQDKGRQDGLKEGYDQGYNAGIDFADGRVNENSASYQQGLSVFNPQEWSIEIRIDKNGPDKEQEFFHSRKGISDNHIEYWYDKSFAGHTILAVYMDENFYSPFGGGMSQELVCLMGTSYQHLSTSRGNALSVSKDSIFWGYVSFNKLDDDYDTLKLKVLYI